MPWKECIEISISVMEAGTLKVCDGSRNIKSKIRTLAPAHMHTAQTVVSVTSRTEPVATMRVSYKSISPSLIQNVQCVHVMLRLCKISTLSLTPRPCWQSMQSEPPTSCRHMTPVTHGNNEYKTFWKENGRNCWRTYSTEYTGEGVNAGAELTNTTSTESVIK
jgi:hypothetical protein